MEEKKNPELVKFIKKRKIKKRLILLTQIGLLVFLVASWEIAANVGILEEFLFSKPSAIYSLFLKYLETGEIFKHIGVSLVETFIGLAIGTIGGIFIAIGLWWSKTLSRILDPFLVVLNALPKTALAPIMIIWAGAGFKGIVVVAVSIAIVITILSAYNYFTNIEKEQVKMLNTFGASKFQILTKLVLPGNIINLINIIKINIGMTWIGVIVGEFLVSRAGIGYLVLYGGQVFRLDLVMMGVIVLAFLAYVMNQAVNMLEKYFIKKQGGIK